MQLEVPDDILLKARANSGDVLLALAIQFYADNRISYEDAVKLSGVSRGQLNRELVRSGVGLHLYPPTARQAG